MLQNKAWDQSDTLEFHGNEIYESLLRRSYGWVCLDLDGTTLNNWVLDERIVSIIKKFISSGVLIIFSTWRHPFYLNDIFWVFTNTEKKFIYLSAANGLFIKRLDIVKPILNWSSSNTQEYHVLFQYIKYDDFLWKELALDSNIFASQVHDYGITLVFHEKNILPDGTLHPDLIERTKFILEDTGFSYQFQVISTWKTIDIIPRSTWKWISLSIILESAYMDYGTHLSWESIARIGDKWCKWESDYEIIWNSQWFSVGTWEESGVLLDSNWKQLIWPDWTYKILERLDISKSITLDVGWFFSDRHRDSYKNEVLSLEEHIRSRTGNLILFLGSSFVAENEILHKPPCTNYLSNTFSFHWSINLSDKDISSMNWTLREYFGQVSIRYGDTAYWRWRMYYYSYDYALLDDIRNVSDLVKVTILLKEFLVLHIENYQKISKVIHTWWLNNAEWKVILTFLDHLKLYMIQAYNAVSYLRTFWCIQFDDDTFILLQRYCIDVFSIFDDILSLRIPNVITIPDSSIIGNILDTVIQFFQSEAHEQNIDFLSKAIRSTPEANHPIYNKLSALLAIKAINETTIKKINIIWIHFWWSELPFWISSGMRGNSSNWLKLGAYHYSRYSNIPLVNQNNPMNQLDGIKQQDFWEDCTVICDDGGFTWKTIHSLIKSIWSISESIIISSVQFAWYRRFPQICATWGMQIPFLQSCINTWLVRVSPYHRIRNETERLEQIRDGLFNLEYERSKRILRS